MTWVAYIFHCLLRTDAHCPLFSISRGGFKAILRVFWCTIPTQTSLANFSRKSRPELQCSGEERGNMELGARLTCRVDHAARMTLWHRNYESSLSTSRTKTAKSATLHQGTLGERHHGEGKDFKATREMRHTSSWRGSNRK